jgi:hypothetical protein
VTIVEWERDEKSLFAHSTALQIAYRNATIDRRNSLTASERIGCFKSVTTCDRNTLKSAHFGNFQKMPHAEHGSLRNLFAGFPFLLETI